jgi:hypothetical protein
MEDREVITKGHFPRKRPLLRAAGLALVLAGVSMEAMAGSTTTNFPDSDTLLNAQHDDANWVLPAKTYAGNRNTGLNSPPRPPAPTTASNHRPKLIA